MLRAFLSKLKASRPTQEQKEPEIPAETSLPADLLPAEDAPEEDAPETGKRADNFRKIVRREVVSAADFKTAPVRGLYDWWMSFQPGLPKRSDFDITSLWTIAPHLYMVEVLEEDRYLYRLNGERVVEIVGVSMRGREMTPDDELVENRLFLAYLQRLVASRRCWRCTGMADVFNKQYLEFETVDCPLIGEDGRISHIIGAIALIEEPDFAADNGG